MPIKKLTTAPTEGDLEAEIRRALTIAFSWLPPGSIKHQTKFSFHFGRTHVEVDGGVVSRVEARADILLYFNEQPLAVLELKRPGNALTSADEEQGLSYARMIHPRPPLVVVTNGDEVRFLETHTGLAWQPTQPSEAELALLAAAAAKAAGADLKRAVEVLLGSGSEVWVQAVRQATSAILDDLSGEWHRTLVPFVPGYLIPRKVTALALHRLRAPERIVIIEGPPLIGKSSVLREICIQTSQSDDLAVLFVEADGAAGQGIFQQLANLLRDTLSWPVTVDEVRAWLQRLSKNTGPALVLAIDGVGPDRDDVRRDIEELSSRGYGQNLRFVIGVDDTVTGNLLKTATGRKATSVGRQAVRLEVGPLDDDEFGAAQQVLWDRRIAFTHGAHLARELRVPWVLRALGAHIVSEPTYQNENVTGILPPLLGLGLIEHARELFDDDHELRRKVREVAKAVLTDSIDRKRPISLILESIATFVVRRTSLESNLDRADIDALIHDGLLKPTLHETGEAILAVRLPELLASELASILGTELEQRARVDTDDAAEWLPNAAAMLPLGDIIGAQAIFDAAQRGAIPLDVISALVRAKPHKEAIAPGTRAALLIPGGPLVDLTFRKDGSLVVESQGEREVIPASADDDNVMFADFESWLILSHLAARPMVASGQDLSGRIDAALLLEVGTCPIVLRAPGAHLHPRGVLTHSIPNHGEIVCHHEGISLRDSSAPCRRIVIHFGGDVAIRRKAPAAIPSSGGGRARPRSRPPLTTQRYRQMRR